MERIPKIRVSTESRPWRRKFSRRSSRDSNPRPFNHESGALTTELYPPLLRSVMSLCIYIVLHRIPFRLCPAASIAVRPDDGTHGPHAMGRAQGPAAPCAHAQLTRTQRQRQRRPCRTLHPRRRSSVYSPLRNFHVLRGKLHPWRRSDKNGLA